MKAPYYKVYIGDEDISEYVQSLNYEDSIKEDNLVTIRIDQTYAIKLADDDTFITGKLIKFQFGYMAGALSKLHLAKVTDIVHVYAKTVSLTVKALDKGNQIKKTTSQKIWDKSISIASICKKIADKNSLKFKTDITDYFMSEDIPQSNRSDFDFIKYLISRVGDGNIISYVRNDTMYLTKRALSTKSKVTFSYNHGDDTVKRFSPSTKESSQKGEANQTAVTSINPKDGTVEKVEVDGTNENKTGTTGTHVVHYGGDRGDYRGIGESTDTVGKPIQETVENKDEAKSLANSIKKAATLEVMTAILVVEGNPALEPNTIVNMKNVAKRYLGTWFLEKVVHKLDGSQYTTTCTLSSNGTKNKSEIKASDANTTVGPKEAKEEIVLVTRDADTGEINE